MGCVQAKPSVHSPPLGVEKMKIQNGYQAGGYRHVVKEAARASTRASRKELPDRQNVGPKSDPGDGEGNLIGREEEKKRVADGAEAGGGGNVSRRIGSAKAAGRGEETVNGWPRWLTDNVPREALLGLVPKSAESYDKLDKIGQGTYSNVYKARDRDTGKIVALKKVRFDTSESESVRFMAREIMILQELDHPNVVKLEGLATSRMQYSLYLVFDFMVTDMSRIINRPDGRLTEPQVKCYMQQLLAGLQHCHERGILHRDIKGSNLLIDKHGMLKIADFGLANYYNPNQKRPLTSRVVTLWYRAPELLLGSTDYGVGIDLWSAGCLLAEMFAGRPIMPGRTEVEQLHRIFKLCGSPPEEYWKKLKLSTNFRPPQPYKPSLLDTFRDFPSSSLGLLSTLLALDPAYRGSAFSALQNEFFSMSPLACDLSGLPVIYKEEDDPTIEPYERRKNKVSKKKRSRVRREGQRTKDQAVQKSHGDSKLFKEEQNGDANFRNLETGSSTGSTTSRLKLSNIEAGSSTGGSTSSGLKLSYMETESSTGGSTSSRLKLSTKEDNTPPRSPSPAGLTSLLKISSPQTECHPWAHKNIKNLPPLLASSKLNNTSDKEDDDTMYRFGLERSNSTSDFRRVDGERMQKRYYAG